MKRNAILRIIIWSLVLILLTGILGSSLVYSTFRIRKSSAATQQAVALQPKEAQSAAAVPLEKMFTFPADEIAELDIEWVAGNITIYPTDRQDITISEAGSTQDKYNMVWDSRNGKLNIKFCDESIISGIGIGIHADLSKDLYVYVPKDWTCSSLELDMAAANLKMWNMLIRELDIDGASGICDIRDCEIGDFDIDTASGDVKFTGTLDALDFDAASAGFTGDFQNTPSRIDMDSMSGKLDIALPEDCGYSLTMAGMSSTFRSDFQGTSVKNNAHVYGDGRCRINVDGMSCDVTIRKLDTIQSPAIDPVAEPVPCTADPCTDPDCTDHGHRAEDCTDESCALHGHTAESCMDENCTLHSHTAENCTDEACTTHPHKSNHH